MPNNRTQWFEFNTLGSRITNVPVAENRSPPHRSGSNWNALSDEEWKNIKHIDGLECCTYGMMSPWSHYTHCLCILVIWKPEISTAALVNLLSISFCFWQSWEHLVKMSKYAHRNIGAPSHYCMLLHLHWLGCTGCVLPKCSILNINTICNYKLNFT